MTNFLGSPPAKGGTPMVYPAYPSYPTSYSPTTPLKPYTYVAPPPFVMPPCNAKEIEAAGLTELKTIIEMDPVEFQGAYEWTESYMNTLKLCTYFKDNGSNVLAIAHLDTVLKKPTMGFVPETSMVYSSELDDRLGAWIILEVLPKLGVNVDVLLTDGEESGRTTGADFEPSKQYNWMFSFDRMGTDVALYQYYDDLAASIELAGGKPACGSYSDIASMAHLKCSGSNWGCGYEGQHSERCKANLNNTAKMIRQFMYFFELYKEHHFAIDPKEYELSRSYYGSGYGMSSWGDDDGYYGSCGTKSKYVDEPLPPNGKKTKCTICGEEFDGYIRYYNGQALCHRCVTDNGFVYCTDSKQYVPSDQAIWCAAQACHLEDTSTCSTMSDVVCLHCQENPYVTEYFSDDEITEKEWE